MTQKTTLEKAITQEIKTNTSTNKIFIKHLKKVIGYKRTRKFPVICYAQTTTHNETTTKTRYHKILLPNIKRNSIINISMTISQLFGLPYDSTTQSVNIPLTDKNQYKHPQPDYYLVSQAILTQLLPKRKLKKALTKRKLHHIL